jgi:hypothetical protein
VLNTLIVSCLRHGKDPHLYLRDVLTRLPLMTNENETARCCPKPGNPRTDRVGWFDHEYPSPSGIKRLKLVGPHRENEEG